MSRISDTFEKLRAEGRKAFIPFVTAGDPDLETSLQICLKLAELGADIIELGVPFSDPMADGPTIQASSQRALEHGVGLTEVLGLAKQFRERADVPIVLFSYFNPILSYRLEPFAHDAAAAGIGGLLLTDVIDDEAAEISAVLSAADIDLISLVAPTSSDERIEKICLTARGFIYAVSRAGVTGAQDNVGSSARGLVTRIRPHTDLPIAVGFGISTFEQIADVWSFADAAVVGSAIVSKIADAPNATNAVAEVESFVRMLLPKFAKRGVEN